MNPTAIQRLALAAAVLGALLALLLFAPARWLADAVTRASGGQVQLVNASGTVWTGRADLLFTGGEGSRSTSALPEGLAWRLRPAWHGGPALALGLRAPCCTPQPVQLHLRPGIGETRLDIAPFQGRLPAGLLAGLGTPWNTLRLEGTIALQSQGLGLSLVSGRAQLYGGLDIDALDLASRLSSIRPLGSYRAQLRADADGHTARLELQTLSGALLLQGQGEWVGGRLRFAGDAQAAPGSELALTNLLNIVGRRDGPRSVITIG
ncbi:type II secretion system protein N [Hydrogenophaga crocea]|uniref:Type II secretion system protein N n=1 Tax=Hydrogenophaga crocea TaxID=2716225 RepID=A0A6G8IMI4_9BURK|nr:type II secretion system protein N [Hydrogenophaga crocea]QIM54381.1 type II secretion system protein N [Hydrogenophaga crocea]